MGVDVGDLKEYVEEPKTPKYDNFTPFFTKKFVFSNHYPCTLDIDGRRFVCTEQYYMWVKASWCSQHSKRCVNLCSLIPKTMSNFRAVGYLLLPFAETFGDDDAAERILNSKDAKEMKRIGSGIKSYRADVWSMPGRMAMLLANFVKVDNT